MSANSDEPILRMNITLGPHKRDSATITEEQFVDITDQFERSGYWSSFERYCEFVSTAKHGTVEALVDEFEAPLIEIIGTKTSYPFALLWPVIDLMFERWRKQSTKSNSP